MDKQLQSTTPQVFSNFVIFKIDNAKVNKDVLFKKDLDENSVCRDFRTTAQARKQCAKFAHTTLDLRR